MWFKIIKILHQKIVIKKEIRKGGTVKQKETEIYRNEKNRSYKSNNINNNIKYDLIK